MNNVSKLKVLKSNAGYYVGRTQHDDETGADWPYDRVTGYMDEEAALETLLGINYLNNNVDAFNTYRASGMSPEQALEQVEYDLAK